MIPLLLALAMGRPVVPQTGPVPAKAFSFVVLGHIRGDRGKLSPVLPELLERVRELKPDFAVITGDMIWGDADVNPSDSGRIETEWKRVDSALATLGVPIYRSPGNHDIDDIVTRDIYFRRYGRPPAAFSFGGSKFLLLTTTWLPENGDTAKMRFIRGHDLDSAQVRFVRDQVADTSSYQHVFVFMHHLLWWEPEDGAWWKDVHPLLVHGKGSAVFSGDLGPMKFSHLERDGIDYFQGSLGGDPPLVMLRARESNRSLQGQFDTFFYVTVNGPSVRVRPETVAEVSSGHFTPARWADVYKYQPPPPSLKAKLLDLVSSPARIAALIGLVVVGFLGGWVVARRRGTS